GATDHPEEIPERLSESSSRAVASTRAEQSATSDQNPEEVSEVHSGGMATPVPGNEDMMAKVLQMMAESLRQLNKVTPTIYAPHLPPYPAESLRIFDGSNVTSFLERYEDMAKYHNFTDQMK